MPFEITNEGDFILVRFLGAVTEDDLERLVKDVGAVEDSLPGVAHRVADFSSVESFEIDFPAMFKVAERRRAKQFRNPVKTALMVRKDVEMGFARMFQQLLDHPQIETRIVRSLQEAREWFAGNAPQLPTDS